MTGRLVSAGWNGELDDLAAGHGPLRIICPFIKVGPVHRLLAHGSRSIRVITRYDKAAFARGVSDTAALRLLLEHGAEIRGVRGLHAKVYVAGAHRAIVTSANLTNTGLASNHEFGLVTGDEATVDTCNTYFSRLWEGSGPSLTVARIDGWDDEIKPYMLRGAPPGAAPPELGDDGTDVLLHAAVTPATASEPAQAFVKFFGEGDNRAPRTQTVLEEVQRSGCHWACSYPAGRRPRQPQDGAAMLLGRLVEQPNDVLVFGRATGFAYVDGRDDASDAEKAARPFKHVWPHYIRVHNAEFIDGPLANGVPLSALLEALGPEAYAPTSRNAARGAGNVNPRLSVRQQPAVQLTRAGQDWLETALGEAFERHGRLAPSTLAALDWPAQPDL